MRTQAAERIPLAFGKRFSGLADQVHENRDERRGEEKNET